MKIQLSDHFTYKKLLRFVLPSIIMMIFTSIYAAVDRDDDRDLCLQCCGRTFRFESGGRYGAVGGEYCMADYYDYRSFWIYAWYRGLRGRGPHPR